MAKKIGIAAPLGAAGARPAEVAVQVLRRDRCVARRGQSADHHRRRQGDRARRQAQFRRQRALPPPGHRGDARSRRRGPRGSRGLEIRPQLHPARRQHRLPRQRRGPGDGDHGHHQALRRQPGQFPRRRRRRHHGEGDRGVQDHAQEPGPQGDPREHLSAAS